MSDTQSGPDWWQASDGKWYPPQPASTPTTPTAGSDDAGSAPAYAPAPVYAQPAYDTSPEPTHPRATLALVLGILSLVLCGLFTGIPAIIVGRKARKDIAASGGTIPGDGTALAGVVLGIIGTILSVIGIFVLVAVLTLAASVGDDLENINTDAPNGVCDESRFLRDPDC